MKGIYRIGNKNIEIDSLFQQVHSLCQDYRTEQPAELFVRITQENIEYERIRSRQTALREGRESYNDSDSYLETLAVYRSMAEQLIQWDTILFHGSVVAVDGNAYLFTAKSGTGKSTHTRLWRQLFGERAVMVNDDKPLIHIGDSTITVFGTPWNGKHHLGENITVPLKAICILCRDQVNHIEPRTKSQAYPILIQQMYRPSQPGAMVKAMELLDRLAENVRLYQAGCNMEPEAAEVTYHGMSNAEAVED